MSAAKRMPSKARLARIFEKFTRNIPPPREPDECVSCDGYGHIREDGTGTIDRRERKCLDCNGTGKRLRTTHDRGKP
jgi:DnaJ-class molecular chaperone